MLKAAMVSRSRQIRRMQAASPAPQIGILITYIVEKGKPLASPAPPHDLIKDCSWAGPSREFHAREGALPGRALDPLREGTKAGSSRRDSRTPGTIARLRHRECKRRTSRRRRDRRRYRADAERDADAVGCRLQGLP